MSQNIAIHANLLPCAANISAFEVDDEALNNLREYSLANNLYWALAEGHACEISARRNAMDVSYAIHTFPEKDPPINQYFSLPHRMPPRTPAR